MACRCTVTLRATPIDRVRQALAPYNQDISRSLRHVLARSMRAVCALSPALGFMSCSSLSSWFTCELYYELHVCTITFPRMRAPPRSDACFYVYDSSYASPLSVSPRRLVWLTCGARSTFVLSSSRCPLGRVDPTLLFGSAYLLQLLYCHLCTLSLKLTLTCASNLVLRLLDLWKRVHKYLEGFGKIRTTYSVGGSDRGHSGDEGLDMETRNRDHVTCPPALVEPKLTPHGHTSAITSGLTILTGAHTYYEGVDEDSEAQEQYPNVANSLCAPVRTGDRDVTCHTAAERTEVLSHPEILEVPTVSSLPEGVESLQDLSSSKEVHLEQQMHEQMAEVQDLQPTYMKCGFILGNADAPAAPWDPQKVVYSSNYYAMHSRSQQEKNEEDLSTELVAERSPGDLNDQETSDYLEDICSNWEEFDRSPRSTEAYQEYTCNIITQDTGQVQEEEEFLVQMTGVEGGGLHVLGMYKKAEKRIKPVPAVYPEDARTHRRIPVDPLLDLPPLPVHPPVFTPTEKTTQERLEGMEINADGHLWPEEVKLFQWIVKVNERSIAYADKDRGTFKDEYFSPYIFPVIPHIPWEHKNIPIPPGLKEEIVKVIKEKIASGVYEPSQSSYRSRWFTVAKKNGKFRIVHDLQPLNAVSIRDAGLPPVLDNFVEPFAGSQIYTCLDMMSGYDARMIAEQSRDMTSFMTPLGLLRHRVMPQGYTNAVAEFQESMVYILQDEIPQTADVFVDDVAIRGSSSIFPDKDGNAQVLEANPGIRLFVWKHAQDVHRIMHRMGKAGGTFAAKKSQMGRREVVILGQKCTPEGRLPDDKKVVKILNWPVLKSASDIRRFLGLCGGLRIWVKDYTHIIRPLTQVGKKGAEFVWGEAQQKSFDKLKEVLTTAPVLRSLDYRSDNPVILAVDSSQTAVGFILYQMDDLGRKQPIRYGSLPMPATAKNYSQPKLELYGLYRAMREWRIHICGVKNLHIEVDAKYIQGMLNEPDLVPMATMNRWIQGILLFDFKLIHVPAEKHKGPDALSRREVPGDEEWEAEEVDNELEEDEDVDEDALMFTGLTLMSPENQDINVFSIQSKKSGTLLSEIQEYLDTNDLPQFDTTTEKRRFIAKASNFFLHEGVLFKNQINGPPLKVILSADAKYRILTEAHEDFGHRGVHAVFETISKRFYWPYLYREVRDHVLTCHECQIRSTKKVDIPLTISRPATIFSTIQVDVMLMPKSSHKGYRYIVVARDILTQAPEARALKEITAHNLARFFLEEIILRYGMIGSVVTDNGSEVKGAFAELAKKYGFPHVKVSPYNARANGVVERGHFILREAIVKASKGEIKRWPDLLHHAVFADKIMARRSTGFSPYFLLHGVEPVMPFDLTESTFMVQGFKSGMLTSDLLALRIQQLEKRPEDIAKASAAIIKMRLASKKQFEKRYSRRLKKSDYQPGELVLKRNSVIEKSLNRKTFPRYLGPYEVVRKTMGGSYVLQELNGSMIRQGVAASRLLPYRPRLDKDFIGVITEELELDSEDSGSEDD